jgi:NADH-quinone oxidoreductase subunit C
MPSALLNSALLALESKFSVTRLPEFRGETTLRVERSDIREIAKVCKEQLGFNYLVDVSSVDNFGSDPRFEVVYELYHMEHGVHLRLKLSVSEEDLEMPSVADIWRTADWHEREVFDMMGIRFQGHPDLRRILMWQGYPFFPLRKDFPLAGRPSEMPDIAFSKPAPLEGGPFVTIPSSATTKDREPRSRSME